MHVVRIILLLHLPNTLVGRIHIFYFPAVPTNHLNLWSPPSIPSLPFPSLSSLLVPLFRLHHSSYHSHLLLLVLRVIQNTKCPIQYSTTNAAMIMPLSFSTATLFPDAAMRVSRVAEPLSDVVKLEKVSLCVWHLLAAVEVSSSVERKSCGRRAVVEEEEEEEGRRQTYSTINNMLIARTIIDIYRYATQRRHFGCEFIEARVVLLFAFVG